MDDQLITFETAKLAKEKGFNVSSNFRYDDGYPLADSFKFIDCLNWNEDGHGVPKGYITATTQSLLQRWLREKHNIHVILNAPSVHPKNLSYLYHIMRDTGNKYEDISLVFKGTYGLTYEDALEVGLRESLKFI